MGRSAIESEELTAIVGAQDQEEALKVTRLILAGNSLAQPDLDKGEEEKKPVRLALFAASVERPADSLSCTPTETLRLRLLSLLCTPHHPTRRLPLVPPAQFSSRLDARREGSDGPYDAATGAASGDVARGGRV